MGPRLRFAGTWVATTALIVLGVNVAIERVARDVSIERPAPMTPSEVDEQLREQQDSPPTTGAVVEPTSPPAPPSAGAPTTSPGTARPTTSSTTGSGSGSGTRTSEPSRPEVTRPSTPGAGGTTTVPPGSSGRSDERGDTSRP